MTNLYLANSRSLFICKGILGSRKLFVIFLPFLYFHSSHFVFIAGWDKHSYGYHGDDGHSFCSSGTGQPYGPTFTTGDVIGCCVNLINNTCFYTKNGHSLGNILRCFRHSRVASSPKPPGNTCQIELDFTHAQCTCDSQTCSSCFV